MRHDTYDDYWEARNLSLHMKNIHCAVLTVGGWFDAEDLQGPFTTFHAIDKNNPASLTGWWLVRGCMAAGRATTAIIWAAWNSLRIPATSTARTFCSHFSSST